MSILSTYGRVKRDIHLNEEVVTMWRYNVEGQDAVVPNGIPPLLDIGGCWRLSGENYIQW